MSGEPGVFPEAGFFRSPTKVVAYGRLPQATRPYAFSTTHGDLLAGEGDKRAEVTGVSRFAHRSKA